MVTVLAPARRRAESQSNRYMDGILPKQGETAGHAIRADAGGNSIRRGGQGAMTLEALRGDGSYELIP
jgi:hypothetical protein